MNGILSLSALALSIAVWIRTRELAERLERLEAGPAPLPVPEPEPVPVRPEPPPLPAVPQPPAPAPEPALVMREPEPEPPPEPQRGYFRRLIEATGGWEALIGGNLLNKLGALALVIGMALFLSFSFTRMGPLGRAATGIAISAAMLGAGVWFERAERYRLFARGLIAAGWASLYFTSYAMHALEATRVIENPAIGAAFMIAVAVGMVAHSLRYRVQTLTGLSFGCVFAALALGESNLFVAVSLIPVAIAMLYLARRFEWQGIELLAAAATYAVFLTRPSTGSPLFHIEAMLLLYWAIFEAFDLARADRGQYALFGLNALAGLGSSAAVWYRLSPDTMSRYCAFAAAAYWVSTVVRLWQGSRLLAGVTLSISSLLTALAMFAHMEGMWLPLGTMLEGELLFAAYLMLRFPVARVLACSVFGFAARHAFALTGSTVVFGVSIHEFAPPIAILALLFAVNRRLSPPDRMFSYAASGLAAVLIGTEVDWRFAGAVWLAFGVALLELGARRNLPEFRYQAFALLTLGSAANVTSKYSPAAVAGTLLTLGTAIRAAIQFPALAEWERRALRLGGSIAATILAAITATRLVPPDYDAIAMMTASVLLFELSLRGLPPELRRPAIVLNLFSLVIVIMASPAHIEKDPSRAVWFSHVTAASFYAWISWRTLRESGWTRRVAPWISAAITMIALWMLLPNVWVPVSWAAVGLALTLLGPDHLVLPGRIVAFAAAISIHTLDGVDGLAIAANSAWIAASHWWLWIRRRAAILDHAHVWTATAVFAAMFPTTWPDHWLLPWAAFGLTLSAVSRRFALAGLRWQAGLLSLVALLGTMFGDTPSWQRATAPFIIGAALLFEDREWFGTRVRGAYGIAAALAGAVTLFREASGGMLTLSWSLEAIALLGAGFALRERPLRWSGLVLLLVCIAKAFLYDLRNLETMYRILSFAGLGAILMAVSWIYTRFRESPRRYL